MNKDCLIVGIAMGMLLCCALMLWFPKERECMVNIKHMANNVTHSFIGVSYD